MRRQTARPALTSVTDRDETDAIRLTNRERQVLDLIADGLTNDEIGRRLFLSVNSVKTNVRTAYRKLGLHRRPLVVRWVLEQRGTCPACGRGRRDDTSDDATSPPLCG